MSSKIFQTPWTLGKTVLRANLCTARELYTSRVLKNASSTPKDIPGSSSTVDSADVELHTKQMHHWWDTNGPMKGLHAYNLIRVPFVRDGLMTEAENKSLTPLKGLKILDVGCGGGILSEPLAKLGATVTGVDASKELIECAQKHSTLNPHLTNKPTYCCTTIEDHAANHENEYDGVVASEIIEHVNNKELFIKSCVHTLKPGGRIFFTTPNRTKMSQIAVIYLAEYLMKVVPRGTHQIEKFITPTELSFLLERNNCHVELTYGIFYNILTNRWSWVNYQTFVFALQAVKLN